MLFHSTVPLMGGRHTNWIEVIKMETKPNANLTQAFLENIPWNDIIFAFKSISSLHTGRHLWPHSAPMSLSELGSFSHQDLLSLGSPQWPPKPNLVFKANICQEQKIKSLMHFYSFVQFLIFIADFNSTQRKSILSKSKELWYIFWNGIHFSIKGKNITDFSFSILAEYKAVTKEQ